MTDDEIELVERDQIDAENVENLNADDLIRLFGIRLHAYDQNHDLSRKRVVGDLALEFRDEYGVNILRVIDERGYVHPDGYLWNLGPFDEETLRKYEPVHPESREEGGTADVRSGDILKMGDDGMVIVGVDDRKFVGMNKSGKIDVHALATLRELFSSAEYDVSLVRDGEVIRGADRQLHTDTERSEDSH